MSRRKVLDNFLNEVNAATLNSASWKIHKGKTTVSLMLANGNHFILLEMQEGKELSNYDMFIPASKSIEAEKMFTAMKDYLYENKEPSEEFDEVYECKIEPSSSNEFESIMKENNIEYIYMDSINDGGMTYEVYKCYPANLDEAEIVKRNSDITYILN